MIRIKCPCCGYYTQLVDNEEEPLFEICEVCFWQYDAVAHDKPHKVIGANNITLYDAQNNYKKYGVSELQFKDKVRPPLPEELPENNQGNQISSHEDSEEHLENQKLKLTMDLLPRGAWDKNLSKTLPQKEWDSIRHAVYERAEYKCEICGAKDGQLEAHEVWEFNVDQKSQKLIDITAICKNCHLVKHFRHTKMIGGEEYAKKHFLKVNQCDEQVFIDHYREAESRFDELSKIESWTVDTSAINELS